VGGSFRSNTLNFRYHGGSGVVSRAETLKNFSNSQGANGMGNTTRMKTLVISQGSRIGGMEPHNWKTEELETCHMQSM